jgi:hypothetical protein
MAHLVRRLRMAAVFGCAFLMTACGSNGPASTEQGAVDNLRSALNTYNSATPTDIAATGSECAKALSGLRGSSLLSVRPNPGKQLVMRQELRAAYLQASRGFSHCAIGAKSMDYVVMARGDAELLSANGSLRQARAAGG